MNEQYAMQEAQKSAYAQQVRMANAAASYQQPEQQPTVMAAAHMEMDNVIAMLNRNTQQLRELKERMFGAHPEKLANSPTPRPVANGSVQLLGEKVETVKAILRDQTALVDELQKVG